MQLPNSYPYLPYSYYRQLSKAVLHQHYQVELQQRAKNGSISFLSSETIWGLLSVKQWESAHFGFTCGMIDFLWAEDPAKCSDYLAEIEKRAAVDGIKHLSIRIDAQNHRLLLALEESGFLQMDAILHFNGKLKDLRLQESKGKFICREANSTDEARLCELAASAYTDDRFHSDPAIQNKDADAAYADWMKNSLNGLADKIYVFTDEAGVPQGFITVNFEKIESTRIAKIWLVGVAPKYQGSGASYSLLNHVIEDLRKRRTGLPGSRYSTKKCTCYALLC